ncbi:MAG: diguanylate cyclase domain-containing protein [Nanobdellota archaeon]
MSKSSRLETRIRFLENKLKVKQQEAEQNESHFFQIYNHLEQLVHQRTQRLEETKNALHCKNEELRLLLDSTKNPFFFKDINLRYTTVNKGFCETFGLQPSQIIGKTAEEVFSGGMEDTFEASDRYVLETGRPIQDYHTKIRLGEDTKELLIDKYPFIKDGQVIGIMGSSLDLTELNKTKEKLHSTEQKIGSILAHFPGIYIELSLAGAILDINESVKDYTSVTRDEIIGQDIRKYLRHPQEVDKILHEIQEKGYITNYQTTIVSNEEERILFTDKLIRKDEKIIGSFSDITTIIDRNHEIQKRLAYEKALNRCSQLLLTGEREEALKQSLEILQETCGCARVNLVKKDDQDIGHSLYEFCKEGLEHGYSRIEYTNRPTWQENLPKGKAINGLTDDFHPEEQAQLREQQIETIIAIPLFTKSGLFGHMGFEDTIRYRWADADVELLETAAHMIETYLVKQENEDRLNVLAYTDHMTGLYNRKSFLEHLHQEIARSNREHTKKTLFYIDLNNFKDINDTFGHKAGDQIIIEVGHRLKQCVRETDYVHRLGGDEFALLLPHGEFTEVAHRIQSCVCTPYLLGNTRITTISPSIGISIYEPHTNKQTIEEAIDQLIQEADTSMYQAKELATKGYDVPFIRYKKQ